MTLVLPFLLQVGLDPRLGETVPTDLVFHDETGAEVRLGDYFGRRPVILALVYYRCPMLCTLILNGMLRSLQGVSFQAGADYEVVAVSINPEETPELAAAKRKSYGRDAWHFLTGPHTSIRALAQAVGYRYKFDPSTGQFAHPSGIMIATPEGKLSRYFYGIEYPPEGVRLALVEASAGKIGSVSDQIQLLCSEYDPATGRYSMAVLSLVRLGGVVTVLLFGAFVLREWRKRGH
jgi:protein SCO1/2